MKRKTRELTAIVILLCLSLLTECGDRGANPISNTPSVNSTTVEVKFLEQYVGANLMPVVPPHPPILTCWFNAVLTNPSDTDTLTQLTIPTAVVLAPDSLVSMPLEFGIDLWDGVLAPHEADTLFLGGEATTYPRLPCGEFVRIQVILYSHNNAIARFITEETFCSCPS
jgi:hypothetical protein